MKRPEGALILALILIVALAPAAHAVKHFVNQVNFTFVPNDLTIVAGDEVEWDQSSGSHTVTNGTGPTDPTVGTLFDAPLNSTNNSFSFHFDTPGDYPYFCRPHFGIGMTGIIRVEPAVPAESETWGSVKMLFR